jgi:hypothetical protein
LVQNKVAYQISAQQSLKISTTVAEDLRKPIVNDHSIDLDLETSRKKEIQNINEHGIDRTENTITDTEVTATEEEALLEESNPIDTLRKCKQMW